MAAARRSSREFSLSVRDVLNVFQAAGLTVSHRHLRHLCHGHHVVLTLPHQTMLWGIIEGRVAGRRYNEDLRRAVEDAFRTITPKMLRRMSQRKWKRIRLFPASRCTYGFTGHVTKVYVSYSNQIIVAHWLVNGDFSPTL